MIQLTTLGATELRRDGTEVRSVLSQPKRLALFAYLRLAAPGGFIARERLLALFWPESDQERARNALRQSLHFLRRSLGDDVVVSRTEREVGIDAANVACDAVAFRDAVDGGRLEDAVEQYRGDFLPGFVVEEAPDVERWVEDRRAEFARLANRAAWTLTERHEAQGEQALAVLWARRALTLNPLDEMGARRLIQLLAQTGDRAAALQAYDALHRRLARELDLEPAPATVQLAERIRSQAVASAAEPASPSAATSRLPAAPEPSALPPVVATWTPAAAADPAAALPPTVPPAHTAPSVRATAGVRHRGIVRSAVIGAAFAVIVLASWFAMARQRAPEVDVPPSVAVLPFLNLSGDAANDYFSDGVTEELLNVLAGVPGLRVAARTSSFVFRGKDVAIDSIARALNVAYVLEGSVRTGGSRVRITAQLIEADGGFHVWSETYDRELTDVFAVQDEISGAIAKQLQIELSGNIWRASARETKDAEAYRLLLRALHAFRSPSPESYATSVMLLEEALGRDPGYARAYGALANVLIWQAYFGWTEAAPAHARADSLARRGLQLAETPEAHLALARMAEAQARDADSADVHFMRALALNPADARALQMRALFLARRGRGDEAIASARRATELDPLHPGSWSNYANVLSMLNRGADALAMMERARSVAPDDVIVLTNLANQLAAVGRLEDAFTTLDHAMQIDSANSNLLGLQVHLLFRADREAEARTRLASLEKRPEFSRFRLATLYENTHDVDRVIDLLEESAARHEDELGQIRMPGMFPGARDDPRFIRLLQSLEKDGR